MGLWPQTTAVTPLETPSFQGLGFPLAEHPVFLGVNLLSREGNSQEGNRMLPAGPLFSCAGSSNPLSFAGQRATETSSGSWRQGNAQRAPIKNLNNEVSGFSWPLAG